MGSERASIFGDDDDLDLSGFAPAKAPETDRKAIREVAEQRGFKPREPEAAPVASETATAPRRAQRRHTTGRNRQLNVKATQETIDRFYAIADGQGWVLGEVLEHAIKALEYALDREASPS